MRTINAVLLIMVAVLVLACEKPVFIPVKGSITGTILDNNGVPLSGVDVTANFDAPENAGGFPLPSTVTTKTSPEGAFQLEELWDKIELQVNHPGFKPVFRQVELLAKNRSPQVDLTLVGSPTVQSVRFSKTILDNATPDILTITSEAQDFFNTSFGPYAGKFLLKNAQGQTALILTATLPDQSKTQYLFQAALTSGQLPSGVYRVIAEVTDPDGNAHQALATEEIRIE